MNPMRMNAIIIWPFRLISSPSTKEILSAVDTSSKCSGSETFSSSTNVIMVISVVKKGVGNVYYKMYNWYIQ